MLSLVQEIINSYLVINSVAAIITIYPLQFHNLTLSNLFLKIKFLSLYFVEFLKFLAFLVYLFIYLKKKYPKQQRKSNYIFFKRKDLFFEILVGEFAAYKFYFSRETIEFVISNNSFQEILSSGFFVNIFYINSLV